jgi:sortase A
VLLNRKVSVLLATASTVMTVLVCSGIALATTHGQLDRNKHLDVGALVGTFDGQTYPYCSGTLISPTVFLTAAHCDTGSSTVHVTFDSQYTAESKLYSGTFHADPLYNRPQNDAHDIAVVVFHQPIRGIKSAQLPTFIDDSFATAALFSADPPKNSTLKLTIPQMQRVREVPVYDGPPTDEAALHDGALHISETGFPWQPGANVYIAGHRLGFPATKSYLVFWDLNKLQKGDEVVLSDANGTRYTYEVFKKFVVNPGDWHVTQPVAGHSVVTLQTCTLPDYSQRLIVQAELKSVS